MTEGVDTASARVRHRQRDDRGRYVHDYGVVGTDEATGREVAECQDCGRVWGYLGGRADRYYKSREAARKAGEPLLEGY